MSPSDDVSDSAREEAGAGARDPEAVQLVEQAEACNDSADYEAALELLERAIEIDPRSARAFVARGWALENLGPDHLDEARAAYEKGVALDPSDPWGCEGLAHMLELQGEREEATRLYRSVVARYADANDPSAELLEIVGWCRHRLGEEEEAERSYRRALEAAPDRADTRFDLALTLFVLGRGGDALSEAMAALERLDGVDPGRRRGVLQVALDDLQEAVLSNASLGVASEVGRARNAMEAAFEALPKS